MPRDRKQFEKDNRMMRTNRRIKYDKNGRIHHNEQEVRALNPRAEIRNDNLNIHLRNNIQAAKNNTKHIQTQQLKRRDLKKDLDTLYNQRDVFLRRQNKEKLTDKQQASLDRIQNKIKRYEKEQGKNIIARKNHSKEVISNLKKKERNGTITEKEKKQLKKEEKNQKIFDRQIKNSKRKEKAYKVMAIRHAPSKVLIKAQDKVQQKIDKTTRQVKESAKNTKLYKGYENTVKNPIKKHVVNPYEKKVKNPVLKTYGKIKNSPKSLKNKLKKTTVGKAINTQYHKTQSKVFGKTKTKLNTFKEKMSNKGINNPRAMGRALGKLGATLSKAVIFFLNSLLVVIGVVLVIGIVVGLWFVITILSNFFNNGNLSFTNARIEGVKSKVQDVIDKQNYGNDDVERNITFNADDVTALLLTLTDKEWLYESEPVKNDEKQLKSKFVLEGQKHYDKDTIQKIIDLFIWEDDAHFEQYYKYRYNYYSAWSDPYDSKKELIEGFKEKTGVNLDETDKHAIREKEEVVVKKGEPNKYFCDDLKVSDTTYPTVNINPTTKDISISTKDSDSGIKSVSIAAKTPKILGLFGGKTITLANFTFPENKKYNSEYGPGNTSWSNSYNQSSIEYYITVTDWAGNKTHITSTYDKKSKKFINSVSYSGGDSDKYSKDTVSACQKNPPKAKEDIKKVKWRGRTLERFEWSREDRADTETMKRVDKVLVKDYKVPEGKEVLDRILYEYKATYKGVEKNYSPLNPYENKADCHPIVDSDNKDIYRSCDGQISHSYERDRKGVEFLIGKKCSALPPSVQSFFDWFNTDKCIQAYNKYDEHEDVYEEYWKKYEKLAEDYLEENENIKVYHKNYGRIYWAEENKKVIEKNYEGYYAVTQGLLNGSFNEDGTKKQQNSTGDWLFPIDGVIQTFSDSEPRELGNSSFHYGMDFNSTQGIGTDIFASMEGFVYEAKAGCATFGGLGNWCNNGAGNYVTIQSTYKNTTYYVSYMHLKSFTVKEGQKIKTGEYIGAMGSSGNSSGAHLHFEVHKDKPGWNNPITWVHPREFIDAPTPKFTWFTYKDGKMVK